MGGIGVAVAGAVPRWLQDGISKQPRSPPPTLSQMRVANDSDGDDEDDDDEDDDCDD